MAKQTSLGVTVFRFLQLVQNLLIGRVDVSHFLLGKGQNYHHRHHQDQVEQIESYTETRQYQGHPEGGDTPGTGQEEQQGVVERAEEDNRGGEEESDQCRDQPGVEGQGRQEERHRCLSHRWSLEVKRRAKGELLASHFWSYCAFLFRLYGNDLDTIPHNMGSY